MATDISLALPPEEPLDVELFDDIPWGDDISEVRIGTTQVGKGVFAQKHYPANAVIGEIRGEVSEDAPHGSEYSMDIGDGLQLEPHPPFCFVNHSCEPNCEFDWYDTPGDEPLQVRREVYLIALRNIQAGEELTIDYNWSAESAIPCRCNSLTCRGWIVCPDELGEIDPTS